MTMAAASNAVVLVCAKATYVLLLPNRQQTIVIPYPERESNSQAPRFELGGFADLPIGA